MTKTIKTDLPGITVAWSPINQAWFIIWGTEHVLSIQPDVEGVNDYLWHLTHDKRTQ